MAVQAGDVVDDTAETVRELVIAGAPLVQVRLKDAPDRTSLAHILAATTIAQQFGAVVVVNDRADLARLAGGRHAHLGPQDLAPYDANAFFNDEARGFIYGASASTPNDVESILAEAQTTHAKLGYIAVGPVWSSTTKACRPRPLGPEGLAACLAVAAPHPVCAVGGVAQPEQVATAIRLGATFVGCSAALDPRPRSPPERSRLRADDLHQTRLRARIFHLVCVAVRAHQSHQ